MATMLVSDQLETVAACPLKLTAPVVEVKLTPEMVTAAPGSPLAGVIELTIGDAVKNTPLLCNPPLFTTTLPLVASLGTNTTTLVSDQLQSWADWPLNVTVP